MSGVWTVFSHEMRQRWMIFPCALLLGIAVLVFDDAALVVTPLLFSSLGMVLALIIGSRMINEDLFSGRLSFFFSLPISAGGLWLGKTLAALVVVAGAPALIAVPAVLFAPDSGGLTVGGSWSTATNNWVFAAQLLLIMAVSHVINLAWRERSIWAVVNLVGAAVAIWLFLVAASRAYLANPDAVRTIHRGSLGWWWVAAGLALALSVAGASALQLAHGRTSPRHNHRVFTLALWSLLVPIGCVISVYALTTPPPSPQHVERLHTVFPAPTGSLAFATGYSPRRGTEDAFLLDRASGSFLPVRMASERPPAFSADGERAVWFDPDRYLRVADAREDSSSESDFEVLPARIRVSEPLPEIALSPDGRSVALAGLSKVDVFDVATGRVLSDRYLPGKMIGIRFPQSNLVRLYLTDWKEPRQEPLAIYELSLETRELRRSGSLEGFGWPGLAVVNAEGTRVLRAGALACGDAEEAEIAGGEYYTKAVQDACLYDGITGAPLADLGDFPKVPLRWARFLVDGRLAVLSLEGPADAEEEKGTLHIFSPEGVPQQRIDLGTAADLQVGAQPDHTSLWIEVGPEPQRLRVDLETGTVQREQGEGAIFSVGSPG